MSISTFYLKELQNLFVKEFGNQSYEGINLIINLRKIILGINLNNEKTYTLKTIKHH